jgi:hypothetical protein
MLHRWRRFVRHEEAAGFDSTGGTIATGVEYAEYE